MIHICDIIEKESKLITIKNYIYELKSKATMKGQAGSQRVVLGEYLFHFTAISH